MTIESVTYIDDLDVNYPEADDPKSEGDDHIRNIKTAIKSTFPNVTGAVTPTHTELNYVDGVTSSIQTQINTAMANGVSAWFPNVNADITATDEELNFVDGVTSNIQAQLNDKIDASDSTVIGSFTVTDTVIAGGYVSEVQAVSISGSTTYIDPTKGNIIYIRVFSTTPDTMLSFDMSKLPVEDGSSAFFYTIIIDAYLTAGNPAEITLNPDLFVMTRSNHTRYPSIQTWEATIGSGYGEVDRAYLTGYVLASSGENYEGEVLTYHYWLNNT